ncbi:GNAT family N-acetyltransferase [Demequina sp. NBRC 110057]|uniref:GNAT family N-acetyltransferase n=1 Tax=Demequina sp. NBRC 110057 TaxID=1570346 RepID=UPI000A05431A|nr:GNAT family N-acetyltransferase [Demequina sp. NBRC 110057]
MIRPATLADAERIAAIYHPYVTDTVITFETETVTPGDIKARMKAVWDKDLPYLVIEHEGKVMGFAYAAPYRPKAAYLHSVETTIYLDREAAGNGLGGRLYRALIVAMRASHAHTAISLIALPNEASVALHRATGWREVGVLTEAGQKLGRWIDVGYFQLDVS